MLIMIDNYDSFTHNLARYFTELGEAVRVVRNDECSVDELTKYSDCLMVKAGANFFVVGSGIYSADDIQQRVTDVRYQLRK